MHVALLRRIAKLPVIRDVLGAGAGCAVALAAYAAFELARGLLGVGSVDVVGAYHAAAGAVVAQGTVVFGLSSTLALAGGCAFVHRRLSPQAVSEID
jgi:hypothetical protein